MYKFNFTQEQLQTINNALIEYPYKFAAPVINDINRQINKQEKTKEIEEKKQKDRNI